jgi:hypothetical protein
LKSISARPGNDFSTTRDMLCVLSALLSFTEAAPTLHAHLRRVMLLLATLDHLVAHTEQVLETALEVPMVV